mmetsp:Transcript_42855/g.67183  ORF Transcript_42855/g.67183 Transcript_42855/m.67183 type:complete len:89 (-) Transcript_42855:2135-2401(-)
MEVLNEKRERFQKVVERLESSQETLQASAETLTEEVKTKMAAVKDALTTREGELLTQVERIEKNQKDPTFRAGRRPAGGNFFDQQVRF